MASNSPFARNSHLSNAAAGPSTSPRRYATDAPDPTSSRWENLSGEDKNVILRAAQTLDNPAFLTLQSIGTHQSVPQMRLRLERTMIGLPETKVPIEWKMDLEPDQGDLQEGRESDDKRLAVGQKWSARAEKKKMWDNARRARAEGEENAKKMHEIEEELRRKNASRSPVAVKQEPSTAGPSTPGRYGRASGRRVSTQAEDVDMDEDEEDTPPVRRRKIKGTYANQRSIRRGPT